MKLSIIIPCKKEAANIITCLERIMAICPTAEIIVVDSGLDNTQQVMAPLQKNNQNIKYILCQPDRGKGDAIKMGIIHSSGNIILQIDADLQFWPEDIPQLIQPILNNKADMTLGSRFMKVSQSESNPVIRSLGNHFFSFYCSLLLGYKISDALAGFKAWKKEVTQSYTLKSYSFTYEIELFMKAFRKNWRICDVPVRYSARSKGQSKVSALKVGLNILIDAVRFRLCRL